MRNTADAVIIGGGVMGCSILYNLAAAGMRHVVLLEQDVLASGSTGKSQAICRTHYSNQVTAQMAWKSLDVLKNFESITGGSSGFVRTGYLVTVGSEDRQALADNVSMQRALGINTSTVSREDVEALAPMVKVEDTEGLAYEPESGYADPYLVTTSYARKARELGAEVHVNVRVLDIEIGDGGVTALITDDGRIETPIAVIATGPWSARLLAKLGLELPLTTIRHQVVGFRRPEHLIPAHPTVGDIAQRSSFRPESTNLTLVGAGEDYADPDSYHQGVDMSSVEESFDKLVRRIPDMSQGFFRGGWSGLFTVTPDWHPILDRVEGIRGLYLAVGFSGHGFKLSPMVGVVMAEMVLEGRARTIDLSPLRLSRFAEGDLLHSRYSYNVLA